ncbi:TPA: AAA family ATPase [Klebsiella pneumoniae]|uniref:AAA family ATPase n=1 Tax=Klebsiella pneumoniae TaxID=573 RepID=UPI0019BB8179|nr:ATP-binding protein [Klebsiella pneumoniae]EIV5553794.1 AAA family ATPase [Klebsiella pneumoniae]MBD7812120.1 AAA family ATPase [Klebsiella pneumoniae]MCB8035439.1 AAA family ATPase [Klebsiella pneumoniae]HBS2799351.1 AAA family ATPase [Klebsiella pneumoniae]HBU4012342.1 AAA family ATPase [Klebsiella pneumoniae]
MNITRLKLKNWKNFKNIDVPLHDRVYIIGPNAVGKSNFLDVFRFMSDICRDGGGLQKAVNDRGGITKLRCLQARNDTEVGITLYFDDDGVEWIYELIFKASGRGKQLINVTRENVYKDGKDILARPNKQDDGDSVQLTQTHLEQILANKQFRVVSDYFSSVTYLHIVPQLLKYAKEIGVNKVEDDPFGQGFLDRLANTQTRTRDAWLKKIQAGLSIAVPQFKELRFERDESGQPHLEARYEHWRPNAGWQKEEQFSDGTLRLIGLMWSLLEKRQLLLLEEPELSLNSEIVRFIPEIIENTLKGARNQKQIIISTHSPSLLSNNIDGNNIILFMASENGTTARIPNDEELEAMRAGFSPAEIMLPLTTPNNISKIAGI